MNVPASQHNTSSDEMKRPPPRYGEALLNGRKRHALNLEDISNELNIPADLIEKIESSAVSDLPPATFMQGYIRAYARLVEVAADPVLEDFARAVPNGPRKELKARSNLPKEADRHSPIVKITSRLLLVCAVMAAAYGIYSYYSEKMQDFDQVNVADAPEQPDALPQPEKIKIVQNAVITEDGELVVTQPAEQDLTMAVDEPVEPTVVGTSIDNTAEVTTEPVASDEVTVVDKEDTVSLYADRDSWVEITDASGARLHYNLVKEGSELKVSGVAPFSIFLGNAPEVTMMLNNVEVQVKSYIRANNTAQFRVSVDDGKIVFHKR